jgi:hypothetical protein
MLLIASGDIPFRKHCCRLRTTQKKNKAAETHSPRDPPITGYRFITDIFYQDSQPSPNDEYARLKLHLHLDADKKVF